MGYKYVINEDKILDPEYYDENKALAILLDADVCFINNLIDNETKEFNVVVYVNCSDTFVWACADAESLTCTDGGEGSEIIELYKLWKENSIYGPVKWICIKRNLQPQRPLKANMVKAGYWDDTLQNLPINEIK